MMTRTLPLLAAVLLPTTAAAQVAVLPVEATNLAPGEADAIGVLLAQAYSSECGEEVIGPAQASEALRLEGSPVAAAAKLGAAEYIVTSAVHLASKLTLRSSLYRADGSPLFSQDMTARSLDDMEQVAKRLAAALYRRVPAVDTRTIHNVTATEGRVPNRTFVEKVMGLKTAFYVPVAKGQRINQAISLQFDGRLEGEHYFLEFGAGAMLPTSGMDDDEDAYGGIFAEIGGSYYLMDDSVSPYVGAGVIPRLVFGFSDGGFQLVPYGQLGVMFMRESSSRLYVDFRVAQVVTPFTKETGTPVYDTEGYLYDYDNKHKDVYPTELTVAVGIGW